MMLLGLVALLCASTNLACLKPQLERHQLTAAMVRDGERPVQPERDEPAPDVVPVPGTKPVQDAKPLELPSAKQIADWMKQAYSSRHELAYDFTVSQVQDDGTWTYKGTARYSGRKSLVVMTEVEGNKKGRQLRFSCDVDGDQAIFTEDIDGQCTTHSASVDTLAEKNWRPEINSVCIFSALLKSWVGGPSRHSNKWHEFISAGECTREETVTDADGTRHPCYVVMNGVKGSYELFFVDKSSHLVLRWWVDRTSISRDSRYTYRDPAPVVPQTFRPEVDHDHANNSQRPGKVVTDDPTILLIQLVTWLH